MNIRPSLKRYFLVSVLVTGIVTIAAMTYVSYHFYFLGVDFSTSDFARANAYRVAVSDGKPREIGGFTVATRWQDLPTAVRSHLHESDLVEDRLLKFVDGNPLLSPPKTRYFAIKLNRVANCAMFRPCSRAGPKGSKNPKPPQFFHIFAIALGAIFLFSLVPVLLLRKIATPWNT